MRLKSLLITAILLIAFSPANAKTVLGIPELYNHPLFNTEYKLAANYVPILALRGLAHAEVYKDKKSAHLERYFYIKDSQGKLGKPYETIVLDITVKGHGIIGRSINAIGKLNEFDLEYTNNMGFSLPRNAHMEIAAKLDGIKILDLDVQSDGTNMTNKVEGLFIGEKVKYQTILRDTLGTLANYKYALHTEGTPPDPCSFETVTKGIIGNTAINGKGQMIRVGYYEFEETYGPIVVKTKLTINP